VISRLKVNIVVGNKAIEYNQTELEPDGCVAGGSFTSGSKELEVLIEPP